MLILGVISLAVFAVLAGQLYRLMIVRYDHYLGLSSENQFKYVRIRAHRGLVYDSRGSLLVAARPSLDLMITPAFCVACATEVLPKLGKLLEWDPEQGAKVEQLVTSAKGTQRYQPLVAQVDLTQDQFDMVAASLYRLPGVEIDPVPHREYRSGASLAHILGYMNEISSAEFLRFNQESDERPAYAIGDYVGRRGLERAFEPELRGRDGWVREVVNARGEVVRDEDGEIIRQTEVQAVAGESLVLSIDSRLQAVAESAFTADAGAIVAMESKTGFIRAILSRPSFDPNEMTGRVSAHRLRVINEDPLHPMLFRPGAQHYHAGSTFKVVSGLAALESGLFTPESQVYCPGGYQMGNRWWRCDLESGHGSLTLRQAIKVSCDVYFYRVADVLGLDPVARVARAFGLGETTNFRLAAEVPGVIPDRSYYDGGVRGRYSKGLALNAVIGQGDINVTPLQMAVLYSAIANGGTVLVPQAVLRSETPSGEVIHEFSPEVARKVEIDERFRALLVSALKAAVNEPGGTGGAARLEEVVVAGKTGTAQVAKLGAVRLRASQMKYWLRDHAWFASFAPADDPDLTVIVLAEHSGFGGLNAAPVAAKIFRAYFEMKRADNGLPPFVHRASRESAPASTESSAPLEHDDPPPDATLSGTQDLP